MITVFCHTYWHVITGIHTYWHSYLLVCHYCHAYWHVITLLLQHAILKYFFTLHVPYISFCSHNYSIISQLQCFLSKACESLGTRLVFSFLFNIAFLSFIFFPPSWGLGVEPGTSISTVDCLSHWTTLISTVVLNNLFLFP